MKFDLIQRGQFKKDGQMLMGKNGVVDLDYMGSAEFEFGAVPRSYRRIMHDYNNYSCFNTGIFTPENDELIVFCNKEISDEIIECLNFFVNNPYKLKEYSELDKIKTSKKNDESWNKRKTDFWWCIDYGIDFMAFLKSNIDKFSKGISYDYENWWLQKPESQRNDEYKKSLRMI